MTDYVLLENAEKKADVITAIKPHRSHQHAMYVGSINLKGVVWWTHTFIIIWMEDMSRNVIDSYETVLLFRMKITW